MHNIHELEKRWLTYKIKSFIPHLSFLLIISITLVIFLNIDMTSISKKISPPILVKEKVIKKVEPIVEVAKVKILKVEVKEQNKVALLKIEPIGTEEENIILTPSFDFIKKLRNSSTKSYKSNDFNQQTYQPRDESIGQAQKQDAIEEEEAIIISRQETQADIEHVIKRFQKNNNPALSLFVAKKYYRLGNYNKAYNYSLLTNELNNNIDESWIIFSKSLVKLKKKDKAIKTLKKYIKHSHSVNAKVLLDDIISGKFK